MARAYAYLARDLLNINVRILVDDHSFALIIPIYKEIDIYRLVNGLRSDNIREVISRAVKNSQLIWRIFRHVANRAFMILSHYKGKKTSLRRQQMNSEIIYNAIRNMDGFPLVEEAVREIIEDKMDVIRAKKVLKEIEDGRRRWMILKEYDVPSPFTHDLCMNSIFMNILVLKDYTLLKIFIAA